MRGFFIKIKLEFSYLTRQQPAYTIRAIEKQLNTEIKRLGLYVAASVVCEAASANEQEIASGKKRPRNDMKRSRGEGSPVRTGR